MSTQTPTPNEDTPRVPSNPADGRNDPAIDPDGKLPEGSGSTGGASADKAKDNAYSPDFAPKDKPDSSAPKDADIDTDGG